MSTQWRLTKGEKKMQINLRGMVMSQYKNVSEFAKTIGWDRKKTSDIVNGKRVPTAKEISVISDALGINDANTMVAIFFPNKYAM